MPLPLSLRLTDDKQKRCIAAHAVAARHFKERKRKRLIQTDQALVLRPQPAEFKRRAAVPD
jgi:hypothetical protein